MQAIHNIYKPYSTNQTSLQPRCRYTFWVFSRRRHENESYREFYTNIRSTYHTCYTKHIQSIFDKNTSRSTHTHTSLHFPFFLHRNTNSNCPQHITYMLHETYTIHILKFTLHSKHRQVLILFLFCFLPNQRKSKHLRLH